MTQKVKKRLCKRYIDVYKDSFRGAPDIKNKKFQVNLH